MFVDELLIDGTYHVEIDIDSDVIRNVEVFKVKVIVFEVAQRRVDRLNGLDDAFFEFVVLYDDRINS